VTRLLTRPLTLALEDAVEDEAASAPALDDGLAVTVVGSVVHAYAAGQSAMSAAAVIRDFTRFTPFGKNAVVVEFRVLPNGVLVDEWLIANGAGDHAATFCLERAWSSSSRTAATSEGKRLSAW